MNKNVNKNGSYPFVQAHRKSLWVFFKFLKFLEVKQGKEVRQLLTNVEFPSGIRLLNGEIDEVLEKQSSLMKMLMSSLRKNFIK